MFTVNYTQAQKFYEGVLYPYNYYNLNPAYTGYENSTSLLLNYRSAGSSIEGMPKQIMFGIHSPIYKNMGLGLRIENYSEGLFNFFSGLIDYSYHVDINKEQSLRFGVSIGYSANSIDNSKIVASDPNAIIEIVSESFTGIRLITATGIVYRYRKFELSMALPRLFVSGNNFKPVFSSAINYRFDLMKNQVTLTPFVYTLYSKDLSLSYDVMLITNYKNRFQLGIGYRSRKALVLSTGINFSDFRINYAADIGISKITSIYNVLHEISITYGINKEKAKKTIPDSLFNPPLIVSSDTLKNKPFTKDSLLTADNIITVDTTKTYITDKQDISKDSLSVQQVIITDKNEKEKQIIVESSTGIYSINKDSSSIDENELDSLIKNMQIKNSEQEAKIEEVSTGIYDIEENTETDRIDSLIAVMDIAQNNGTLEIEEQDETYMNQYFTILVDIENSTDAVNKNIELLEDFNVRKNTYGALLYTYGKFLTKDAAEKSALNLKNKGFKILKITQIGKL
ncbi:MAG: PorP/SprF family type IX secretion system membrane protein [Bacteroidales bacterium]|nr:PorP/SprF family type IX secretion system membrane protein [Bacteroidales bacterium]